MCGLDVRPFSYRPHLFPGWQLFLKVQVLHHLVNYSVPPGISGTMEEGVHYELLDEHALPWYKKYWMGHNIIVQMVEMLQCTQHGALIVLGLRATIWLMP